MTKIVLTPPSPTCGNRYLAMPWGQFGVTLSPPAIRPLGRYVAGREGIVSGLIFGRWGRIATLSSRSDPWRRRRPPQVRETWLGVLLHPAYRLGLRRRLVDAYRADPPADEPPSAFFVYRGEGAALVRTLSVEAVGSAGPCDGHEWRLASRRPRRNTVPYSPRPAHPGPALPASSPTPLKRYLR
jgi:hypothetical protein